MSTRRQPLKRIAKRTRPYQRGGRLTYPPGFRAPRQRAGYASVARARGAAVTGEMKYFDTEQTGVAVSAVTQTWAGCESDPSSTINLGDAAVANPLCLFAPKVSAALNGRIGRNVKMMKCRINGQISCPAQTAQTGMDAQTKVRIILVQDMQTNAGQMNAEDLLNGTTGNNPSATINTFQNPNFFGRFRILKDKIMAFQNPNTQSLSATNASFEQEGFIRPFKMSYKFREPVTVHFNATSGGTVADIVDHSLHILTGTTSTSLVPAIAYYSRVCYKE